MLFGKTVASLSVRTEEKNGTPVDTWETVLQESTVGEILESYP